MEDDTPAAVAAPNYASWGQRFGAAVIDRGLSWLVFNGVFMVAGSIAGLAAEFAPDSQDQVDTTMNSLTPWLFLVCFALWIALLVGNRVMLQGRTGQSLGKRVMRTALVDSRSGLPVGSPRAFGRWLSHLLDWLPLGAGWLAPLWDQRKQCFADAMTESVVVRLAPAEPRARLPQRISRWLTAHQVERKSRMGPKLSVFTVVAIYALGFGLPIYVAIYYLATPQRASHHPHAWSLGFIIETSLVAVATVLAALVLTWQAPSWVKPTSPGWRSVTLTLKTFGLGWSATAAGSLAGFALGMRGPTGRTSQALAWPDALTSLMAGPAEEIVVLALPLVFLRAAKWPWSVIFAVALALRIAYHVYYGFPVAGFAVWAIAVMFIYLRTHAILGLILAHSYWDLTITVGDYWSPVAREVMFLTVVLALIAWAIVSLVRSLVVGIRNGPVIALAAASPEPALATP